MNGKALGRIETSGFIVALEVADVRVKASNLKLISKNYSVSSLIEVEVKVMSVRSRQQLTQVQ